MPFLATSIIPLEKITPAIMPRLAIIIITTRGATLEPIEEFKKFTASLLTPTIKSKTANPANSITAIKNNSVPILPPVFMSNNKSKYACLLGYLIPLHL
jgi:hypothetical protein